MALGHIIAAAATAAEGGGAAGAGRWAEEEDEVGRAADDECEREWEGLSVGGGG